MHLKWTPIAIILLILLCPTALGVCTVTLDQSSYSIGETATATMTCSEPQERSQAYNFSWYDQTGSLLELDSGITPGTTGQAFFETYQIHAGTTSGSGNLTGNELEGSDTFTVIASNTTLIIQNVTYRNSIFVGQTTGISFQVYDGDGLPVNGAYCSLAVEDGTLAPVKNDFPLVYVVDNFGHSEFFLSFNSFREDREYATHITCNFDVNGDGVIDKYGGARFPFTVLKWLDVNTVVNKAMYEPRDEIFICANVTNLYYDKRITLEIFNQVRCSADGDNDSDLDRALIMSDDNMPDIRGISVNTTQMQCKRFIFPEPKYLQGTNSLCYASTVVNALNEEGDILVSYATTSNEFNLSSESIEVIPDWIFQSRTLLSTRINLSSSEYSDYNASVGIGHLDINLINDPETIAHEDQYTYTSADMEDIITGQDIVSITAADCNGTPVDYRLEYVNDGHLEIELIDVKINQSGCYDVAITIQGDDNMIATVLMFTVIAAMFIGLSLVNNSTSTWGNRIRWAGMTVAFLQIVMMAGTIYGTSAGKVMTPLLRANMWIVLLIGFGLLMFTLYIKTVELMTPGSQDDKDKW